MGLITEIVRLSRAHADSRCATSVKASAVRHVIATVVLSLGGSIHPSCQCLGLQKRVGSREDAPHCSTQTLRDRESRSTLTAGEKWVPASWSCDVRSKDFSWDSILAREVYIRATAPAANTNNAKPISPLTCVREDLLRRFSALFSSELLGVPAHMSSAGPDQGVPA